MKPASFIVFAFVFISGCITGQTESDSQLYAVAERPTPVLNTADFSFVFGNGDGNSLHFDGVGLVREIEFVALPKTVFKIEGVVKKSNATIYKVTTEDYPYPTEKGYYVDGRFVRTAKGKPIARAKALASREKIIERLRSAEGYIYVWGGNFKEGMPEMLTYYPPASAISDELKKYWMLNGVDCSGLLYEATEGFTPRNASSLVSFGEAVKIAGLTAEQIVQKVEPLDIIVWKEHVAIVLDKQHLIESRHHYEDAPDGKGGVRIEKLEEVLNRILKQREPVDNYEDKVEAGKRKFVIRRWYAN